MGLLDEHKLEKHDYKYPLHSGITPLKGNMNVSTLTLQCKLHRINSKMELYTTICTGIFRTWHCKYTYISVTKSPSMSNLRRPINFEVNL